MSNSFEYIAPSDVHLLLRADAEQCWLHREVLPVLREVEAPGELAEEEVGAALAYLEATWSEATARARETDAAARQSDSAARQSDSAWRPAGSDGAMSGAGESPAGRYHAAVRVLREIVAERISPFVEPGLEFEARSHGLRVTDKRPGGCQAA